LAALLEADKAVRDEVPLHMTRFAEELAAQLKDAIIFDEAITNSPELCRYIPTDDAGTLFPDARAR